MTKSTIMSASGENKGIFCCDFAVPTFVNSPTKLHKDPNRKLHECIFQSFVRYAVKKQQEADMLALLREVSSGTVSESPTQATQKEDVGVLAAHQGQESPVFKYEELISNPLTDDTEYCIHLVSRHDFGLVFSHRYFICPKDLNKDWVEVTLTQWWAKGKPFDMKAHLWDLKCQRHANFFRLSLRPNLNQRSRLHALSLPHFSMEDLIANHRYDHTTLLQYLKPRTNRPMIGSPQFMNVAIPSASKIENDPTWNYALGRSLQINRFGVGKDRNQARQPSPTYRNFRHLDLYRTEKFDALPYQVPKYADDGYLSHFGGLCTDQDSLESSEGFSSGFPGHASGQHVGVYDGDGISTRDFSKLLEDFSF
jgi:hypothetical protein